MPSIRRLDPKKARDGVWFSAAAMDYRPIDAPIAGEVCVRVARWDSPAHRSAKARAYEPHLRDLGRGKMLAEDVDRCEAQAMADAILLDWADLTEDDEKTPIPYSRDAAVKLLLDPTAIEFRQFVMDAATIHRGYALDAEARIVGESHGSSNGDSAAPRTNGAT